VNDDRAKQDLDAMLRSAMTARPQPAIDVDLPARAIDRARVLNEIEIRRHTVGRWIWVKRFSSLAASLLIVALLVSSIWRLSHNQAALSALTELTQSSTTDTTSTDTGSTSANDPQQMLWIIGGFALTLIALAAVWPVVLSDEQRLRYQLA
jgi:hypothetical protein